MRFLRSILGPGFILAIALLTGGWFLQQGVGQEQNVYYQVRLFEEVVDHVADHFVDSVERDDLYDAAIDGLIEDLDDANTEFLTASDWSNLRIRTEGEYGGVGLEIVQRDNWITVVSTLPGTPGERAGIRAGDRLVEVEGESAEGWDANRAVSVLRGRPGTDAEVRIERPGVETPIPFTLTRAVIQVRSVPFSTMLEGGAGYVPLQIFSESSESELRMAVEGLVEKGASGLVLDLRGNPGGLLNQGVALADMFLDDRLTVVETRGRSAEQNTVLRTSRPQSFPDLSLIVLIDERSASASEILAGALQDHDRALVIGATSYGKGSVQTLYRLSGGNVLKLTTARWFTPSGRSIQKEREPGVEIGEDGVLSVAGRWSRRPSVADREPYESFGGRKLFGGGGITPDLQIPPDTLTDAEQSAVLELYAQAGRFNIALFGFAVRYIQDRPDLTADFRITNAELARLYDFLLENDVEVDRSVLDRAERYIRFQLEREIGLQREGDAGEFSRLMTADAPLQRAVELLGRARSPEDLFTLAGEPLSDVGSEDQGASGSPD